MTTSAPADHAVLDRRRRPSISNAGVTIANDAGSGTPVAVNWVPESLKGAPPYANEVVVGNDGKNDELPNTDDGGSIVEKEKVWLPPASTGLVDETH